MKQGSLHFFSGSLLHRIVRNILSNYAVLAFNALVGFVLTPLLFHYLHPVRYAILMFSFAVASILQMLDLGLTTSLIRFVSDLGSRGLIAELKRTVSSAFFFLFGLGIVASIGLAILSKVIAHFFLARGTDLLAGEYILAIVGLSLAFDVPGGALRGHLLGCQDFHLANAVEIVSSLLRVIATIVFIELGWGLLAIAAIFPLVAFIRFIGFWGVMPRSAIPFWPNPWQVRWGSLKSISGFAALSFVENTANGWLLQLDNFIAARLLPLPELAILSVARRFPLALTRLGQQGIWVGYPLVSATAAGGGRSLLKMKKFMLISTRSVLALTLPLAAGLFVWAEIVLRVWVGPEVLPGVPVFRALLLFGILASAQESPLTVMYGLGRIRFSSALSVVLLVLGVGVGAWACWAGGLLGLACALTGLQALATVLLYWQALKMAETDVRELVAKALVPVGIAIAPAVIWLLISYRLAAHTLVGMIFSILAGLALFAAGFFRQLAGSAGQSWMGLLRSLLEEVN